MNASGLKHPKKDIEMTSANRERCVIVVAFAMGRLVSQVSISESNVKDPMIWYLYHRLYRLFIWKRESARMKNSMALAQLHS